MTRELDPRTVSLVGTSLIEASAGTGKTYAITSLYVRLLVERQLTVEQILVVTYTRAATAELRDRIRSRLRAALVAFDVGGDDEDELLHAVVAGALAAGRGGEARRRLVLALRSFDQAAIFTIHGFCQRTLQNSAFESGVSFETELITAQQHLVVEIAQDFWARELYGAPRAFVEFLSRRKSPVTVDTLVAIAGRAARDPTMPVLPAQEPLVATDVDERWRAAHTRARELWMSARDEIIELLAESPALNRNKYRLTTLRGTWVPGMDSLMRPGVCVLPQDFAGFVKFTTPVLASSCKKGQTPPSHEFFDACDAVARCDEALVTELGARERTLYLDLVDYTRTELARRKERAAVQSFDDLLHRLAAGLRAPGGGVLEQAIRSRYPAALIDEFQDTDPLQYEVFRRVYHHAGQDVALSLFLIGDPKQAIYAFRGADVFAYMDARRDAADEVLELSMNWRSDPRMIAGVNALFQRARAAFVFEGIEFHPARDSPRSRDRLGGAWARTGGLRFMFVSREDRTGRTGRINKGWGATNVPPMVAGDVVRTLSGDATIDERGVVPGDIAILCRTNRQVAAMQEALRALGVPSVLEGDASVFDTPAAGEVERVLRAVADPGDARWVRSAIATVVLGGTGDELAAMVTDEESWDRWLGRFRGWAQLWRENGFIQAYRSLLDQHGVARRLLALPDGERRLTNVHHLGEILQTRAVASGDGPEGLLRWLTLMRCDPSSRTAAVGDTAQLKLESDADAVKLVTIHKSKGLEYAVVYCPFLWDGKLLHAADGDWVRFHDEGDGNRLKLDFGSPQHASHVAAAEREALAENLRLLYVALTRAKHKCTVVWGAFGDVGTSALGYLLHQPAEMSTDSAGLAAIAKHIESLSDEAFLDDLGDLVARAAGAVSVEEGVEDAPAGLAPSPPTADRLTSRQARRVLRLASRSTSFSALVSGSHRDAAPGEQPVDQLGEESETGVVEATTPANEPVTMAAVPRGARAGQMMHAVLEQLDFPLSPSADAGEVVEVQLTRFGFARAWAEPLARGLDAVLDTPLFPTQITLRQVPRASRLDELEFTFATSAAGGGVTPAGFAAALAERDGAPWNADYLRRVERLDFEALDGYVHGFADLVFVHEGRWYLVDYKSNHLGDAREDYVDSRMREAMAGHHYVLQYHIYLVALHRYLGLRLADYSYDEHFGGVFYLFLRGMDPAHPDGCGVFYDRPPAASVDALSRSLGAPPRVGGDAR